MGRQISNFKQHLSKNPFTVEITAQGNDISQTDSKENALNLESLYLLPNRYLRKTKRRYKRINFILHISII